MSNLFQNGQTSIHTYLSGPEGLFAIMVKEPNGTQYIRYIHTDHLGSWNTITDAAGNRLQEINFDAWGNRRDPNTWQIISNFSQPLLFDRGFTGHEHLTEFNLINMNGRVYDPTIMRFLSPDPFIQAPDYSQSFNRYSYVMNNPMNLTDKSGFYWEDYDVIPPGLGLDPEKDREFIEYLENSGFLLDQVEVVATRLDMSSDEFGTQFWLFHDGFGFDREYDEEYTENTTHNSWENSSSSEKIKIVLENIRENRKEGNTFIDVRKIFPDYPKYGQGSRIISSVEIENLSQMIQIDIANYKNMLVDIYPSRMDEVGPFNVFVDDYKKEGYWFYIELNKYDGSIPMIMIQVDRNFDTFYNYLYGN